MRRRTFAFVTLFVAIVAPAVAAELLLRVIDRPVPLVSGWRAPVGRMRFQINELGFRGQPVKYSDRDYVVLLLGDSQVQASSCAYEWMPERRLEEHLSRTRPVRVFSLAAEGYGQDQELLALEDYYRRFRADLVIVWETPGNDIWNNTFPTGDPEGRLPKPTYWLEDGALHGPTSQPGQVISPSFRLAALVQQQFPSWDRDWEARLPRPYEPLREYTGPVDRTWQTLWDQHIGTIRTDNLATEKSHVAVLLTPRSARSQYGIDLTHRLLERLSQVAHAHHSDVLTFWVDTPDLPDAFWHAGAAPEAERDEAVYVLNGRYYRASHRQKLANMADVNRGLDNVIERIRIPRWRTSPTDGHFNQHAVDDLMRHLAATVEARPTFARERLHQP